MSARSQIPEQKDIFAEEIKVKESPMENQHQETKETGTSDEVNEIQLTYFQGTPFPKHPFNVNILEEAVQLKPDPTDIFVVTYPKCGTTWMQFIVWGIVNRGTPPPSPNKMMFSHFPFLEFTGVDKLSVLPKPRLMKTHLPFHLQPYHPSAKYIYVMRNPWDCCVSYYHHMQVEFPNNKKLSFDTFFDHFIKGKVPYGDFFDHVLSWYAHKNNSNILFLTYEEMSADRKGTMLTVAKFLGDDYHDMLKNDEEVLNNCLKHSEFKYMKDMGMFLPKDMGIDNRSKNLEKDVIEKVIKSMGSVDKKNVDLEKFKEWDFFRKGIIGDWKNYFSEDQIRRFTDYIKSKTNNSDIMEILHC